MLLLLLAVTADASCLRQEVDLVVDPALQVGGSLYVRVVGGDGTTEVESVASRIRLRDPAGDFVAFDAWRLGRLFRFDPRKPLTEGTYLVERKVDYDPDAKRVRLEPNEPVNHSGWFVVDRIEVGRDDLAPPALPTVDWARWRSPPGDHLGFRSRLDAVGVAEGASRVDLEVYRVGVIDSRMSRSDGYTIWTGRTWCTPTNLPLPVFDDLRVRVVAVGPTGLRTGGEWTDLGPSQISRGADHLPDPAEPIGKLAKPRKLSTWKRVRLEVDWTETSTIETACGRLQPVGQPIELGRLGHKRGMLHDGARGLHYTWIEPGVLHLDGRPIQIPDIDTSTNVSVTAVKGRTFLLLWTSSSASLLVVEKNQVLTKNPAPELRSGTLAPAEPGFELRYASPEGSRFTQRYDREGAAIGERTEIFNPIQVQNNPIRVNGHEVPDAQGWHSRHHQEWGGAVYVEAFGETDDRVIRAARDGTVAWDRVLPGQFIRSMVVDADGVHALVGPASTAGAAGPPNARYIVFNWQSWDHDGNSRDPIKPPERSLRPIHMERVPRGSRTLLKSADGGWRLSVIEDERATPSIEIAGRPTLHVAAEHVDVGWIEDREVVWRQRYACGGEPIGIPDLWRP